MKPFRLSKNHNNTGVFFPTNQIQQNEGQAENIDDFLPKENSQGIKIQNDINIKLNDESQYNVNMLIGEK